MIYLVSPAGFPNYGDELIARAWLRYIAVHRPFAQVVLDCPRPGPAALLLRGANPRAHFVNTLWELSRHAQENPEAPYIDPERPWEWVGRAASSLGVAPREGDGVALLLRASTVHLLGGGYVNAVWPGHVCVPAAIAEVARTTGARAVATGAGLTPLLTGAAGARLLADAHDFEVFDVADRPSFDALAGVGSASFTGDDAWLARAAAHPRPGASTPDGGVVLCLQSDLAGDFAWGGKTGEDALARFAEATLDAWDVAGQQVTVVECIPGLDARVPEALGDRLDRARWIPFMSMWRTGLPPGATWLSTRFHPHLLAAAAGASGVAISIKPDFYATRHRSLIDAGSRWTLVAGDGAVPARPTAGGFPEAARADLVRGKRDLARRIYGYRRA